MPRRIGAIEIEKMKEEKEETQEVRKSKKRNIVIRDGLHIEKKKKATVFCGERKGWQGMATFR